MVDGTEHEPTEQDGADRHDPPPADRAEKPISFDFKLRLGSKESTAALTGRATGELVQLQPIDWDAFTGLRDDDAPREYKTNGDLPSIIVELANQIAGPDTLAQAAVRMGALTGTAPAAPPADAGPATGSAIAIEQPAEPSVATEPPVSAADAEDADWPPTFDDEAAAFGEPLAPRPLSPPPVEMAVTTVDDDPMLSAVVGQILDVPPPAAPPRPVTPAMAAARVAAAPKPPAQPAPPSVAPAAAPSAAASSAVAPAVRAPAQPVPEGPIEVPRIVALTPDLPSGEVAQSTPAPGIPATEPAPSGPTMVTGAAALALATTAAPPTSSTPAVPALQLARIERKPDAARPTAPVDFHALLGQAGLQTPSPKKRKKRRPFRALVKLVVVLGIIGGGLYFGKKYVLDMRWDSALKPFADEVSEARGLSWNEPIEIETLPIEEYAPHLVTLAYGPTPDEEALGAEYRAMGLIEGDFDMDTAAEMAAVLQPVMYDPTTKTIYELADIPEELRAWNLHIALDMALIDQHFAWSDGLDALGRSERTARMIAVQGDGSRVAFDILDPSDRETEELAAQSVEFSEDLGVVLESRLDYVVDLLAGPTLPAIDLLGKDDLEQVEERNALVETPVASDGPLLDGMRGLDSTPTRVGNDGDIAGMAYWYYVLASRLPSADAWTAAVGWNGDTTGFASTPDGDCVTATISSLDETSRQRLLGGLQQWAAAAPPEATTTVTELGSERIDVRSCDPGTLADVKTDGFVQPWGFASDEYGYVFDIPRSDEDARSCVINAVRNFGVLAAVAAGDDAGAQASVDLIIESCSTPAPAPAPEAAPAP